MAGSKIILVWASKLLISWVARERRPHPAQVCPTEKAGAECFWVNKLGTSQPEWEVHPLVIPLEDDEEKEQDDY